VSEESNQRIAIVTGGTGGIGQAVHGAGARRASSGPAQLRILLALLAITLAAAVLTACGATGAAPAPPVSSPTAAAAANTVKTAQIGGVTVLTDSEGFTLYSFAPDTPTTSKCYGTCARNWPPAPGPVAAAGVTGTFGTIKRTGGSIQATFDGHPLYTFAGDTAPGQNKGNGLNAAGGLWSEIAASGAAPAGSSSPGSAGAY
jgi:predicted lipoprotein with Yx(FWY)xxD motif